MRLVVRPSASDCRKRLVSETTEMRRVGLLIRSLRLWLIKTDGPQSRRDIKLVYKSRTEPYWIVWCSLDSVRSVTDDSARSCSIRFDSIRFGSAHKFILGSTPDSARTHHAAGLAPATDIRRFLQVERSGLGSADKLTSATQCYTILTHLPTNYERLTISSVWFYMLF